MGRYAMVVTATGVVDNIILYDGVSPFTPPAGIELVEVDDDNRYAEIGGTWNGSEFARAPVLEPTRTEVLMHDVTRTQKFDEVAVKMVDKTADEIAAEKAELKTLLLAELGAGDLVQDRTQMLLRLERE